MYGYESQREFPDGRSTFLQRKMFTWAIVVGPTGEAWFDNHWCYTTRELAESEFKRWNPMEEKEPSGWIRNPQSRRRRPDGDKDREYVER